MKGIDLLSIEHLAVVVIVVILKHGHKKDSVKITQENSKILKYKMKFKHSSMKFSMVFSIFIFIVKKILNIWFRIRMC